MRLPRRLEARLKQRLLKFAWLHLLKAVTPTTEVASFLREVLTHCFKPMLVHCCLCVCSCDCRCAYVLVATSSLNSRSFCVISHSQNCFSLFSNNRVLSCLGCILLLISLMFRLLIYIVVVLSTILVFFLNLGHVCFLTVASNWIDQKVNMFSRQHTTTRMKHLSSRDKN